MNEKIQLDQQHPEQLKTFVERLGLEIDKPVALTAEDVEQILRELGGSAKAHLDALAAYLEGKWRPEEYQEKLKQTGGRYTPDTYFDVNPNVRVAPNGHVNYKDLNIVINAPRRSDDKKLWELKWNPTRGNLSHDVRTFADDFENLQVWIARAQKDGQQIPNVVQEKFLSMKLEHEERARAFEQGREFIGTFQRTNLEKHYSAPTAPEKIEMIIKLKDNSNPDDPTNWRVDNKDGVIVSVKKISEQTFELELSRGEGDASSGEGHELKGTITVNTSSNQIIGGTLYEESGYADGSYEAEYTLNVE
jgi:hypothetical protein